MFQYLHIFQLHQFCVFIKQDYWTLGSIMYNSCNILKLVYSSTVAFKHIEKCKVYFPHRYMLFHSKLYFEWTRVTVRAPTWSLFFKVMWDKTSLKLDRRQIVLNSVVTTYSSSDFIASKRDRYIWCRIIIETDLLTSVHSIIMNFT